MPISDDFREPEFGQQTVTWRAPLHGAHGGPGSDRDVLDIAIRIERAAMLARAGRAC